MKLLLVLLLSMAVFRSTKAAVGSEKVLATKDQPNKCVRASDRLDLAVGESRFREGCSRVSCRTKDGQLFIDEESCGVVSGGPRCRVVQNKSKDYPACCPKVIC